VSQRVAEIGIRVALGADAAGVLRLVLRGGLRLIAVGLAAGVATALAVTPFVRGLLFGVPPTDPLTFGAVGAALLAVGVAACWVPARAALAVDPVRALRGR
jgi:ABC-type lipoprotein release transport system permease subunit